MKTAAQIAKTNHEDPKDAASDAIANHISIEDLISALHAEYPGEIDTEIEADYRKAYGELQAEAA